MGKTQQDQTQDQDQDQDLEDGQGQDDQTLEQDNQKTTQPPKAKTPEEYEDEILQLRATLRKTRQEAARRRIDGKSLKQQEGDVEAELNTLRSENEKLVAQIKQHEALARRARQEEQVKTVASKLRFKHPGDLVRLGDIEFDPESEELDLAEIEGIAKKLARQRPELIDVVESPDLNSQQKGKSGDALPISEADLAQKYGIRYTPTSQSKE